MNSLKIDLTARGITVLSDHLKVGGTNPEGVEIKANSLYLTLGGKPWFPVVGEFHYARYPREEWEVELLKMKAGGITVVASYAFWIYHEETEGTWDWTGSRDLRAFIELCGKHGLYAYPRLGPWAHGEVRNGGLPDWILKKGEVRKNAEPYMTHVLEFYGQIAHQLEGLLWKDGGPVIGLQIENELTDNPGHLLTLKNLARELGMDVPLYTITGWMRVQIPPDEMLPVFAGYPDAFWSPVKEGWARESRVNYFFSHNRDDATIGADLAKTGEGRPDETMMRYPYGTVELGGGMHVSYRRRPVIEADDIVALALTKIGSGSNMQGYYMYHGGVNAIGALSTLNETRATGYPNETPVMDYDFQAPLGKYGQRRESFDSLRLQHMLLKDFGSDLAPLPMTLPELQPEGIDDRDTLRWSVRSDGKKGFIFINNYQRIEGLPEHRDVQFELRLPAETLKLPVNPITIPAQSYMIWPFRMDLGGVVLNYATAQPLCRLGSAYVFFALEGIPAEFSFEADALANPTQNLFQSVNPGTILHIKAASGPEIQILLLTREQALQAYKAKVWGQERLLLSKSLVTLEGAQMKLETDRPADLNLKVFPAINEQSEDQTTFQAMSLERPAGEHFAFEWSLIQAAGPALPVTLDDQQAPLAPDDLAYERAAVWKIEFSNECSSCSGSLRLCVDYVGDVARAYIGDRLVDDDFYSGRIWEIGLNRFMPEVIEKGLTLKILPLRKDSPVYIPDEARPVFGPEGEALELRCITAKMAVSARVDA